MGHVAFVLLAIDMVSSVCMGERTRDMEVVLVTFYP